MIDQFFSEAFGLFKALMVTADCQDITRDVLASVYQRQEGVI